MSRERVDILAARAGGKAFGRQAVWEAIRALADEGGDFSAAELMASCLRLKKYGTVEYIRALHAGGYLAREDARSPRNTPLYRYRLIKDCGLEAPRLRADGSPLPVGKHQRLWEAMKCLRSFTARDICAVANAIPPAVSMTTADSYIQSLHQAGYLIELSPGKSGKPAVYRLARNTGGAAPQIQRTKAVFDPNTYEVFLPEWRDE